MHGRASLLHHVCASRVNTIFRQQLRRVEKTMSAGNTHPVHPIFHPLDGFVEKANLLKTFSSNQYTLHVYEIPSEKVGEQVPGRRFRKGKAFAESLRNRASGFVDDQRVAIRNVEF